MQNQRVFVFNKIKRFCNHHKAKFCNQNQSSIDNVDAPLNKKMKKPNVLSMFRPKLTKSETKEIQNLVCIHITVQHLSFAFATSDYEVKNWSEISLISSNSKFDHHSLLIKAKEIVSAIPFSDMYVFEERLNRPKYLGAVPIIVTLSILEAMIITLLSHRNDDFDFAPNIYFVKNNAIAKFFNLKVGQERVSGQEIVSNIINCDQIELNLIRFSDEKIVQHYLNAPSVLKEHLCNTLLLSYFVLHALRS